MFGLAPKYVDFLLNIVTAAKDHEIECLNRDITLLRLDITRERRRADMAVDQLLASSGKSTVMPERTSFNEPKTAEDRAAEKARQAIYDSMKTAMESVGDTGNCEGDVTAVDEIQ